MSSLRSLFLAFVVLLGIALAATSVPDDVQAQPAPADTRKKPAKAGDAASRIARQKARRERKKVRSAARRTTADDGPPAPSDDGTAAVDAPAPARPAAVPPGKPATPAPRPAGPAAPVKPSTGTTTPARPASGVPGVETDIKEFQTGLPYEKTPPSRRITFNLEDADLPDLVRLISQITGQRFILPGKVRSIKATVFAPTKVTAAEAYQAFLSILELNGMALVPAGRYLKVVESGRIEGRAIPLLMEGQAIPTGDRYLTRLHRVRNISAEDASSLLERFKSGDGSLTAYAPTNLLIVTDTGTNIRRMLRILDVVDVPKTGEQIWVEPVYHADASELAARLTEIFETTASPADATQRKKRQQARAARGKAAAAKTAGTTAPTGAAGRLATTPGSDTVGNSGESRLTKILADERTNSLIILATERAYLRIIELLKYLDVSLEGEGRIHVHHLQHSDSEEIASTLSGLVGGSGAKRGGKAAAAATSAETIFEGKVAVTAHKASNALVITSSQHDYAALRHVIDMLDTERKQVFIEAVIMELSVNRGSSLGTSFHTGIPDVPADGSLSVVGFQAQNTIGGLAGAAASGEFLSGLAVGVQGPIIADSQQLVGLSLPGFGVAINAMASSGDANVLSTPHLIAMDNVEAEISVGQNVPLQTGSSGLGSLGGLGGLSALQGLQGGNSGAGALGALAGLGGGGFGGAVPRQDVGTTITITPHINDTDEIRLEITEEISSAGAPSDSGDLGVVSIDRTRAKTEVVVRDMQTVVIGGLMRDQVTRASSKVPVLGDIPILGALFRSNSKTKVKKNLILFLTPYIVRSPSDLRSIYERKMRERQEFLDRYFVFGDNEYEAPIDYSRTRGLVSEIMVELALLDEKRQLAAEAAARPELVHAARAAVGQTPEKTRADVTIEPDGTVTEGDASLPQPPGDGPSAAEPMPQPEKAGH